MSDLVIVAVLVVGTTLAMNWLSSRRLERKVEQGGAAAEETRALMKEIELSLNSRMSALLERTAEASRLAGMAAERTLGAERAAEVAIASEERADKATERRSPSGDLS